MTYAEVMTARRAYRAEMLGKWNLLAVVVEMAAWQCKRWVMACEGTLFGFETAGTHDFDGKRIK